MMPLLLAFVAGFASAFFVLLAFVIGYPDEP